MKKLLVLTIVAGFLGLAGLGCSKETTKASGGVTKTESKVTETKK